MNPAVVFAVFVFVYGMAMFLIGTRIGPVIRIQRVSRDPERGRGLGVPTLHESARSDGTASSAEVSRIAHTLRETR